MGLPPTHRVDHTPRVILSTDDAWDIDRVEAERAASDHPNEHPWIRFCGYRARGDLATVREYLLEEPPLGPPLIFELRRLTLREMAGIEARELTNAPAARNTALALALVAVEGVEFKIDRGGRDALSDATLEKLRALIGDAGVRELGNHAIACSRMELTEPEKKP